MKNKLKPYIKNSEIPKSKLLIGIFLGLFSAFSIYSVLYITREIFRMLSISDDYDLWILTDKEVNFYNLFFALISLIFAQSIAINFWVNRPRKFFDKLYRKKNSILVDNRVLNLSFFTWFGKLAIFYGLLFGMTFKKGYYVFSFYPDYQFVFVLIIIVLFLQTWTTIRITFKNSFKLLLFSASIILLLAIGLSKINLIDYNKINQSINNKCVVSQYNVQLPHAKNYEKIYDHSIFETVYIVLNKRNEPIIIYQNNIIELSDLKKQIRDLYYGGYGSEYKYLTFGLCIDKRIRMEFVNNVKSEMANSFAFKIAYLVIPEELEYDKKYYTNLMLKSNIQSNYITDSFPENWKKEIPHFDLNYELENNKTLFIKQVNFNEFYCNDTILNLCDLSKYLEIFVLLNSNHLIAVEINDNDTFENYFKIFTIYYDILIKIRNEYCEIEYSCSIKEANEEQINTVNELFPFNFIELTKEMINEVNN